MFDGSLRVLRFLPPLKLVAMIIAEILLKVALSKKNQIKSMEDYVKAAQIHKSTVMWIQLLQ